MILRKLCTALPLAALILNAPAADTREAAVTPAPSPASPAAGPAKEKVAKLVLDKGTPAAEILDHYGKPFQVKPLESPDASLKVEQWIYRRKTAEKVTQEHLADTTEVYNFTVRSSNGNGATMPVKISTPVLKTKRTTTYQVTSLLLVNGALELAKQWTEQEESYL